MRSYVPTPKRRPTVTLLTQIQLRNPSRQLLTITEKLAVLISDRAETSFNSERAEPNFRAFDFRDQSVNGSQTGFAGRWMICDLIWETHNRTVRLNYQIDSVRDIRCLTETIHNFINRNGERIHFGGREMRGFREIFSLFAGKTTGTTDFCISTIHFQV
jgi:hypothetical protein